MTGTLCWQGSGKLFTSVLFLPINHSIVGSSNLSACPFFLFSIFFFFFPADSFFNRWEVFIVYQAFEVVPMRKTGLVNVLLVLLDPGYKVGRYANVEGRFMLIRHDINCAASFHADYFYNY